jgi:hypothetical protein
MSQNGRDSNQDGSRPWACRNDQNGMSEIPSGDWSCINEAADDFERAWKEGPRPAIEDYLGGVAEPRRSLLLHELLRVERELRLRDGEVPRPEDYYERLPGDRHVIEAAFRRRAGSPPASGDDAAAVVAASRSGGIGRNGRSHPPGDVAGYVARRRTVALGLALIVRDARATRGAGPPAAIR